MRLAYEMEYIHPVSERASIQMVRYSAEYLNAYKRIFNECYHKMREGLNIHPYDFIQDDSFFESGIRCLLKYSAKNANICVLCRILLRAVQQQFFGLSGRTTRSFIAPIVTLFRSVHTPHRKRSRSKLLTGS